MRTSIAVGFIALACAVSTVRADVSLPSIFSDHMVLQRQANVPIWGKADPGEAVTVSIGGTSASAMAGADGKWKVVLKDLKGGPDRTAAGAQEMTVQGKNKIVIKDVLIGEVWLGSGQSNMDFRVSKAHGYWCGLTNEAEEIAAANHPGIRMYMAESTLKDEPQWDVKGAWTVCTPQTVGEWSAVAYFFGRELHDSLDGGGVPVGLVVSSFGASTAQAWISPKAIAANPALEAKLVAYEEAKQAFASGAAKTRYEENLKKWEEASAKAKAEGKPAPKKPGAPKDPQKDQHNPAVLYHGMLTPLAPYAIKGVIWYQGESNGVDSEVYLDLMKTLITDWRELWGQGDLPFIQVQLANINAPATQPVQVSSQVARVRDAQLKSSMLPNAAMATAVDIGEAKNVHPKNKLDVGRRLAAAARVVAYGEKIPFSGPVVAGTTRDGSKLKIKFEHADGGLVAKEGKLAGFALQNDAGQWVAADAAIEGTDTLVLSAEGVTAPQAARYAWADNPTISLYNGAGFPASPFRTDDDAARK